MSHRYEGYTPNIPSKVVSMVGIAPQYANDLNVVYDSENLYLEPVSLIMTLYYQSARVNTKVPPI